ncbi:AraC family transcriptional regulator [Tolypothrix campylonemoides VB511288]|nr:AraC family transcriptional regulator [Tolypothrix campylonemoides VB511288]
MHTEVVIASGKLCIKYDYLTLFFGIHLVVNLLPIIEVCDRVGFQNPSHFTAVFRRFMGTTPKAYREETRN